MASNSVFAELLKSSNKLDGSNFTVWKRKIMFLLTAENIEYVVMTSAPTKPAADASDDEKGNYAEELGAWTKDNKKARIFILGSMTDSLAGEYESETSASKIFRRPEQDFGEVSLIKVLSLLNRFLSSKMGENTSINEHLNKLSVLVEDLKNAGHPFTEQVQVMVALNSLPSSWEQFKISFCHMERTLNLHTLRHHLLMEEDRKLSQGKERSSYPAELHLGEYKHQGNKRNFQKKKPGFDLRDRLNKRKDRDDTHHPGKEERRDRADRNNYHQNQKLDKKDHRCHSCGEYGHFRADCNKRRKLNDKKGNNNNQDSRKGNQSPEDGCEDCLSQWYSRRRNIYEPTRWFYRERKYRKGLQIK
uniref:Uncharacterized protein n=1 Tax=Avena sativa TaxID=4498 RepID=A0ACD5YBF3_AVESA